MGTATLTPNQKKQSADSCRELIELESKDTQFFYRIVTMDETWVHHFDPLPTVANRRVPLARDDSDGSFAPKHERSATVGTNVT